MKHRDADVESWRTFVLSSSWQCCWWCGSTHFDKPRGWYSTWMIERAHIVSSPRIEDRRVAILLCSRCHRLQHGEQLGGYLGAGITPPTLAECLWLKSKLDPKFYDRRFMERFSVGRLPRARRPSAIWYVRMASHHRGKMQPMRGMFQELPR